MASKIKLFWTNEAVSNLENILNYLSDKWTDRELNNFKTLLSRQINLIKKYPTIFPVSEMSPRLRKAVLSSQTILYYELKDQSIYIIYLFDTHQNPLKIH